MIDEPIVVYVRHSYSAPVERVFDAWLDPETVSQWLFATPLGHIVRVEIDARVAGAFLITDRRAGKDVEHAGTYLRIDRPRWLVFEYGTQAGSQDRRTVAVEFSPTAGGCEVHVSEEVPLKWAEKQDNIEEGWTTLLNSLATVVEG